MAWIEGEKIGNYILGKQIGQGGMATVYKGYHAQLDREVAIKVMHQNFMDDETFVARFRREAQIVAKLTHPNIVPVYDFDEHEGQPYLVMKQIEGLTLKQLVNKNPLTLDEILRIMSALGSALTYAHKQGVLHRDIKPSNIVIDTDGHPYLTDFGLARLAASGESTMSADMLLGTPHYISPEQAKGIKNLDGRADIYSLGVVLYELLVGHVPFTGDTPYSIIHDHIYTPLPIPSQINPEIPSPVEMVLYKAMEKNPEDRYATADDMVQDLKDAIEEANFTELDPDRVSVAAVSLAKVREEMEQSLAQSPSPAGIKSPLPTPSPSLRSATLYPEKPKRWYQEERVWPIGGCAALLLIAFISIGVLLNMSSNFLALLPLLSKSGGFNFAMNHEHQIPIPFQYQQFKLEFSQNPYPYVKVPYVPFDELPTNVDDPFIYLLEARSLYGEGKTSDARQTLLKGASNTPQLAIYLGSITQLTLDAGDTDAAVFFALVTLEVAYTDDTDYFNEVRPALGKFIYNNVAQITATDVSRISSDLNLSDYVSKRVISQLSESESVDFAISRLLIVKDRAYLAAQRLKAVSENNKLPAEFELLRGELAALQGDSEAARGHWQGILEMDNVPQWVSDRAKELLN